ncbi:MAG: shikimate kinase [Roseitalea sp.]|nr:shikimate kinase [Roseitalea sp.]MBO6952845.1 shikimate kinase [Rhizobiaceae bacterium]MBO6593192.1 shikimate kinase [Roseitalea sp.]MBO6600818.1 shikimate kinase [Roseitalea sp.]MBO6612499.1 shikimate kinase [Roseitalea sp.]
MTEKSPDMAKQVADRLNGRPVVLIGLMGAGKSAIGRKLAARLELPFIDADHEIEEAASMSVADIFEHYGEAEFRRLEASVMTRLLGAGATVLATGGGAFMNADTRAAIGAAGVSVWLSADLDLLMARVSRKATRPLLRAPDPRAVMQKLMDERYPVYATADVTVISRDVGKDEMADTVVEALHHHLCLKTPETGTIGP